MSAAATLVAAPDPPPATVLVRRSPALPLDGMRVEIGPDPCALKPFTSALRVTVGPIVAADLGLPPGGWRVSRLDLPRWFAGLLATADHGTVVTVPARPAGAAPVRVYQLPAPLDVSRRRWTWASSHRSGGA